MFLESIMRISVNFSTWNYGTSM